MSKKSLVAPFASLLGLGRARAEDPSNDDDERKQREDESDADYAKRMEELDDKENAARADDEDTDDEASRAESEDGDDDDKKDDKEKAARAQERTRCARIIAHGVKIGAVNQAGVFAFDTTMSAASAISALNAGRADAGTAAKKPSLTERMAGARTPNPGASAGGSGAQLTVAEQIVLAGKKRRGEA